MSRTRSKLNKVKVYWSSYSWNQRKCFRPVCGSSSSCFCVQGSNVKTDYGPLLHTLAEFGWSLTCVLPTPIIRHDRYAHAHHVGSGGLCGFHFAVVCAATGTWPRSRLCFCRGPSEVLQPDTWRTRWDYERLVPLAHRLCQRDVKLRFIYVTSGVEDKTWYKTVRLLKVW